MLNVLKNIREYHEDGFTMIELLVVILIIGILAAIAIPTFMSQRKTANDAAVVSDVKNTASAIETWMASNPKADQIPEGELDLVKSEGVTVEIKGSASQGFCVSGWHSGGKHYTSATESAVYDSVNGGLQKTPSSCPDGTNPGSGPIEITPVAQTVKFHKNGTPFFGTIEASLNTYGGVTLTGTTEADVDNTYINAGITEITCTDGESGHTGSELSLAEEWKDKKFVYQLSPMDFRGGCIPESVTLDELDYNNTTVAETVTVSLAPANNGGGGSNESTSKSGDIEIRYSADGNPGNIVGKQTKINININGSNAAWSIDDVGLPGHIVEFYFAVTFTCKDGSTVGVSSYNMDGSGTANLGSCEPTYFITSGAISGNQATVATATIRL